MISVDEKELKKEKRRQEREEKRNQQRQKKMQANEDQKNGKKMSVETKKKLSITGIVLILILLILLFRHPIMNFLNNAGRENPYENYLLLPDVTGYEEKDALTTLKEAGFVNIKRSYIIDQFTQDGCVVKTNYHINSQLKPDEEITIYICDKSLISNNETENDVTTTPITNEQYFSMNNISIIDMAIRENYFYAVVRNNNTFAIKNIDYKIGYQDENGLSIGEYKYQLDDDLVILSGEKWTISCEIKNMSARYLYLSGFNYETISVPTKER